jgi:hypothetical protein
MRISPISIAFAALALAQSVLACDSDSTPIFDCQASNGHKFIELCSSPSVDANGYLQYRFGSLDKDGNEKAVEFEYPTNRSGSLKHFVAATYIHEGTYTQSVRFATSNFSYSVFTQVHGKRDQGAGVEVRNLSTGKTTVISCNERPRFYIFELKGLLACDPQTPLGKVCIE